MKIRSCFSPTALTFALVVVVTHLYSPPPVRALDRVAAQVHIEATIVEVNRHDEMLGILDGFRPRQKLDALTEGQILSDVTAAVAGIEDLINNTQADTPVSTDPAGIAALGHMNGALQTDIDLEAKLLALEKSVRSKVITKPVLTARNQLVGGILSLQDRPDRVPPDNKRFNKDVTEYWSQLNGYMPHLAGYGLPEDRSAIYEPFSGGKKKKLPQMIGLMPDDGVKLKVKKGYLQLSGDSKEQQTAGVNFSTPLTKDFTILLTFWLQPNLNKKKREALEGFSAGVKVSTDASDNPTELFLVEHQTTPDGWAQTFTANGSMIVDVFPHVVPNLDRVITNFVVKDGDTMTVGGILHDGSDATLVKSTIPVLGDVPVLGFFFRNGTKKTKLRADNLIIMITPHVIKLEEE